MLVQQIQSRVKKYKKEDETDASSSEKKLSIEQCNSVQLSHFTFQK